MEQSESRIVRCFHCRGVMKLSARAMSVFCPRCQKRVNLEDIVIAGSHPGKVLMTCGDIRIEPTARLHVDVFGRRVEIHGRVVGQVKANESVVVGPTGRVTGDIQAPRIVVREGAVISGRCAMVCHDPLFQDARPRGPDSAHAPEAPREAAPPRDQPLQQTERTAAPAGPAMRRLARPSSNATAE